MKQTMVFGLIVLIGLAFLRACNGNQKDKTTDEIFEEILKDPRINTRETGEREGIKYFQYMENGKTGFRDLEGKIAIKAIYESAEMFSEGHSVVEVDGKWGLINEKEEFVLIPQFESLGALHHGLLSFRSGDKWGFIDLHGKVIIKPKFDWVDEFSEGLCAVSTDFRAKEVRKYGYIDTTGGLVVDLKFHHAQKFENGIGKVQFNQLWGAVDKDGKIIVEPMHKSPSDF